MNQSLYNKNAIVTGSARGVGKAIALAYGKAGANVTVNYRSQRAEAENLVAQIEQSGGKAAAIQADMSKVQEIESLFKKSMDLFGAPDIVVANAGIELINTPIVETSEEQFDRLYEINVKGTYFTLREAAKSLNRNGRLIVIGSTTTVHANAGFSAYAGSKAAGRLYVETLAQELGPRGITVNGLVPGPLGDAGVLADADEAARAYMAGLSPMNRMGGIDDVTGAALFLVSQEAGWVSGQHLIVNGAAKI